MDLEPIKLKLFQLSEYSDAEKETKYQSRVKRIDNAYPDEGWRIPDGYLRDMQRLNEAKLKEIKKDRNDDTIFQELVSELDNLKANKIKKENELTSLIPPNSPNRLQRLYTAFTGRTNTADHALDVFDTNTRQIRSEIWGLEKIISGIEKLIPIYQESQTGGVKRKTRRNRHSNKSRKNHRKSNYFY